jgi:esterase
MSEVRHQDEFDTLGGTAEELDVEWAGRPKVERREVITGEGTISAVVWGDGPAASVLLHGRGPTQSARSWDAVALGWSAPCVAIDFPGHGFSPERADRQYTPRRVSGAVADALTQLTLTPTNLIGVSFGGLTAIAIAASRPELVAQLVLVDVLPWVAHAPTGSAPVSDDAVPPPVESFGSLDEVVDVLATNSPRSRTSLRRNAINNTRQLGDGRWAWRFDPGIPVPFAELDLPGLWEDLAALRAPVTLVRGGGSPVVSDEAVVALKARRSVTVVTVPESGHEVHDEKPSELAAILTQLG